MHVEPQPTTAGLLQTVFGPQLRALGAIDGGRALAPDALELRFASGRDALAARAAIRDTLDGVRLLVRTADGRDVSIADASHTSAGEAAELLSRAPGVLDVDVRTRPRPCIVVWAERPDDNAALAPLLRLCIAGVPLVWQTRARD